MSRQLGIFEAPRKSAVIDPTGTYRYRLERVVSAVPHLLLFIMLNPSTADAELDDATIRKICAFAIRWGYGRVVVVNLFALRSTDPKALAKHADPVGPENDAYITAALREAKQVVCAWGNHGALNDRDLAVRKLIADAGIVPIVLGLNKPGSKRQQPVHPLYQPNNVQVSVWIPRDQP